MDRDPLDCFSETKMNHTNVSSEVQKVKTDPKSNPDNRNLAKSLSKLSMNQSEIKHEDASSRLSIAPSEAEEMVQSEAEEMLHLDRPAPPPLTDFASDRVLVAREHLNEVGANYVRSVK